MRNAEFPYIRVDSKDTLLVEHVGSALLAVRTKLGRVEKEGTVGKNVGYEVGLFLKVVDDSGETTMSSNADWLRIFFFCPSLFFAS